MKTTLFAAIMDRTACDAIKPDYSGTWKINFERCDLSLMGLPAPHSIRIEYSNSLVPYRVSGLGIEGEATCDGESLVTQSVSPIGNTIRYRMTLSRGGRTLTCRVADEVGEILYVFDKQ